MRFDHPNAAIVAHGVVSDDRREALLSVAQVKTSEHLVMDALRVPGLDPELTYRVEVPPLSLLRSMPFGPAVAQPEWITDGLIATGRQLAVIGVPLPVMQPESALLACVTAIGRSGA